MSKMYNKVKEYYESGKWSEKRVRDAIGKWITKEEYIEIVGENQPEELN